MSAGTAGTAASWRSAMSVYRERQMVILLLLGFSSGLPLLLILSTLTIWLREAGVSRTTIGYFAYVLTPFALKFLWAPLFDAVTLPLLGRWLGRRRSWLLVIQTGLLASIFLLSRTDPAADLQATALATLLVAFFAASQDIVIDAYRIESLPQERLGAGAGVSVVGYRCAMWVASAGALFVADAFGWQTSYALMSALVLVGAGTVMVATEPSAADLDRARPAGLLPWVRRAVLEPFGEFMARRGPAIAIAILAFISLYKASDVLLTQMAGAFYVDLGFTKSDIAQVSGTFGLFATLLGGLVGGLLAFRLGILGALLIGGALQAGSNLMFAALATVGPSKGFYVLTIAVENVSGGIGNAAFIAYLSSLCSIHYTAVQYALLTSFMQLLAKFVIVPQSGGLADALGWIGFFCASALFALPGLAILLWLWHRAGLAAGRGIETDEPAAPGVAGVGAAAVPP